MEPQYQDNDNEFERMSGEDLQLLSIKQEKESNSKLLIYNLDKQIALIDDMLNLVDISESREEVEANQMGSPFDE